MARLRPTEVRAVVELLDSPAEDVTALAESVIQKIDDLRSKRPLYAAVIHQPRLGLFVYGPYDTQKQAEKALSTDIVAAVEGSTGGVFRIVRPGGDDYNE